VATDVMTESASARICGRSWSAVDVDTEERIDRDLRRPKSWRKMLYGWLIEYNRY